MLLRVQVAVMALFLFSSRRAFAFTLPRSSAGAASSSLLTRAASTAATEKETASSTSSDNTDDDATAAYDNISMDDIISLCKRRGFIFPSSEIYNGYAGFYDYGPLGAELKREVKDAWWKTFVIRREDVVGLDSSIIHNPTTWKSSGTSKGVCCDGFLVYCDYCLYP